MIPACNRSIQTSRLPQAVALEFSWDHQDFRGSLEVVVHSVVSGHPVLEPHLFDVLGPGRVFPVRGPLSQSGMATGQLADVQ